MAAQRGGTDTGTGFQVRRFLRRPSSRHTTGSAGGNIAFRQPRSAGAISVFAVVMLCIGLSVAATFGEFAVGVLAPAFERDLASEPSQLGLLMAVMFACNALFAVPAGVIADKVDPRKTIFIQMAVSALAFGSIALVTGASQLYLSVAAIGAIMSLNPSVTNRIVVDFVPLRHRASAVAWKSVGLQVSALLVGLSYGLTESFSHWRTTTLAVTIVLLIVGVAMHLRFRRAAPLDFTPIAVVSEVDPATRTPEASTAAASTAGTSAAGDAAAAAVGADVVAPLSHPGRVKRERIAAPIVWWLIPYCLFTTGAFTCVSAYMVLYGTSEAGVSPAAAANASGIAAGISIVARFIWVKWLTRKNEALMLGLAALSSAVAIGVLALSPYFGEAGFWFATILIGFTLMASTPVQQVVLVQNANPRYIGRVSSAVGIAISLSLAGMPFVIALFIEGMGLRATWIIVIGIMMVGVFTMVLFTVVRAMRRRKYGDESERLNELTV